ncbi:hypothetical protein LPJ63_000813 [Coemansia sp. RSA 2711]|nr:hypothetical protein LPJ63_000813 [Coemansia sp. RSA 2711]KAJ1849691.1 hypothetical protein LPJ70_000313 [Coemansia sp. RSA 2708]KAJ2310125.1 hypothetical protein IWW54_003361 [Coemansia sp. RSA 2705]KAJ2732038.1 hypothetical protein H4R23_002928 [Coemansia sp. Cherry 401B]
MLGAERSAVANVSSPLDLARKYDQKNAKKYIAALVNGTTMWDMQRPIPPNTTALKFLQFDEADDPIAKKVFWHSSAHVMGAALEQLYGDDLLLCDGPALPEGGFFYEFLLLNPEQRLAIDRLDRNTPYTERINQLCGAGTPPGSIRFLAAADTSTVQKTAMDIAQGKHSFERMDVDFDFARELFLDNPFKLHFIDRAYQAMAASNGPGLPGISLYRCGSMIDLCRGPHVVHTAQLRAFMVNRVSSAHWVGHLDSISNSAAETQQTSPVLNRVYGISFPTAAMLKTHQSRLEAAAQRDHRAIGKEQKLFMMHPWAPGSGFILPHGLRMVNTIMATIRQKYAKYGFDEVSTPLMFNRQLWQTSGHWDNYREDMFTISADALSGKQPASSCCDHHAADPAPDDTPVFGLKPMNCPGHCLIFASDQRSYKDLPVRYADFSPLHRNEIAGALSGLTRVRKFHQDDGHIFCARNQVEGEIESCLSLIGEMYKMFGFASYELVLSTRPEKYMGGLDEWNEAEAALTDALNKSGKPWVLNQGDGAFYGPKIDVRVQDALGRKHQTATIQLDFQLPRRFQLKYTGSDGKWHQPVMIHRAVLGSMERMLAILIEHWGGKWPFWINPRQAIVIPTTTAASAQRIADYAHQVRDLLANDKDPASVDSHRFFVDIDVSGNTLNRAVREAQLAQYSFILIVGEKELSNGTVDVRQRQGGRIGAKSIAEVKAMFQELIEAYQ